MIGTLIGRYKILRLIGEGGMASVYEAKHETLGTKAAIKILNPILSANKQIRERFKNEAKMMASFDHPNITRVLDYEESNTYLAITMEMLAGVDMNVHIKEHGKLEVDSIKKIFSQVLSAFSYAHKQGIVHRDIKPSNIFLLPDGKVKILDFGIAKLFGQGNEMTQTGTQMGTPIYMSPEQVKADKSIDHRSDIYSLGVTMYYALNGKPPYDVDIISQYDIFTKIVNEPLCLTSIAGELVPLIKKACEKDREQRYQSCEEWLAAMKEPSNKNSNASSGEFSLEAGGEDPKPTVQWASIPLGTFIMGSPADEVDRSDDEIEHYVIVSGYKISAYKVTFDQYDAFCEATGRMKPDDSGWGRGKRPVINVSWSDATAFADWMGCRLPTEAEWEYACRAGSTTPFNTGYNLTTDQANYDGNFPYNNNAKGIYRAQNTEVGNFAPNAWGLYDMHGNVYEWCSDWYSDYPSSSQTNPSGPSEGLYRVFRGGRWSSRASSCRSANRSTSDPDDFNNFIGFRIVSSE